MNKIEQAKQFAHTAHDSIGQKRKYTGEPYWVHVDEVAEIVKAHTNDEDMIAAAYLHDVIEDVFPHNRVSYSYGSLRDLFGERVADLVIELTDVYIKSDYGDFNRAEKKLERDRIARISPQAKVIKLADLISNTKSIVEHDPDFARVYLREKNDLLKVLIGADSELWSKAHWQLIRAAEKLGIIF